MPCVVFPPAMLSHFFRTNVRNPGIERGTASSAIVGHLLPLVVLEKQPDAERGRPSSAGSSKVGRTASLLPVGEARPACLPTYLPAFSAGGRFFSG